ncbi:MAG: heme peroxidase family protein [Nocardioides sp.]
MTDAREAHHGRETFFIEGEGVVGAEASDLGPAPEATAATTASAGLAPTTASAADAVPDFRFSRMGPKGRRLGREIRRKVGEAMTGAPVRQGEIPAGYTYLGQFVDHDLTFDNTVVAFGAAVSPADLVQGRSPALDLDSVYGAGPLDPVSKQFYETDGVRLKIGRTAKIDSDPAMDGFDLPRRANAKARIPDFRNDENLAVAQHHAAFIRFHNRIVGKLPASTPPAARFERARRRAVLHYQWMLRTDYLTRICDKEVVDDVFTNGRKAFEVGASPLSLPTMPVEFSVGAFRFGHSMVREAYDWNARFPNGQGSLDLLFFFSATSGPLGFSKRLPSNWIADWRRLYRFAQIDRADLKPPPGEFNVARRIDTGLVDPLAILPKGSFGGGDADEFTVRANLAFRNLTRAGMIRVASGQQMAAFLRSKGVPVTTLTKAQIRNGKDGASLAALTPAQLATFQEHTPLWFYALREAELNEGRLTGVGARIVAETFHRAMEGSRYSIVRDPDWRPSLGPVDNRFRMADLLVFAFENKKKLLAPLGD